MSYGEWLREARKRKNMSQRDLEAKSGVTQANISQIEIGRQYPRLSTKRKLEAVLGGPHSPDLQEAVKDFLALWYTPQGFSSSPEEHYANLHDAIERLREAVS